MKPIKKNRNRTENTKAMYLTTIIACIRKGNSALEDCNLLSFKDYSKTEQTIESRHRVGANSVVWNMIFESIFRLNLKLIDLKLTIC